MAKLEDRIEWQLLETKNYKKTSYHELPISQKLVMFYDKFMLKYFILLQSLNARMPKGAQYLTWIIGMYGKYWPPYVVLAKILISTNLEIFDLPNICWLKMPLSISIK